MTELIEAPKRRKVLSLKKEPVLKCEADPDPSYFLHSDLNAYMVWSPQAEMPKRVYAQEERDLAILHARDLAKRTGFRFYVMRSWRGYEPK